MYFYVQYTVKYVFKSLKLNVVFMYVCMYVCMYEGVAFKKTFSYAGFEQQSKHLKNPPILLLLNVECELELK